MVTLNISFGQFFDNNQPSTQEGLVMEIMTLIWVAERFVGVVVLIILCAIFFGAARLNFKKRKEGVLQATTFELTMPTKIAGIFYTCLSWGALFFTLIMISTKPSNPLIFITGGTEAILIITLMYICVKKI